MEKESIFAPGKRVNQPPPNINDILKAQEKTDFEMNRLDPIQRRVSPPLESKSNPPPNIEEIRKRQEKEEFERSREILKNIRK